VDNPAGTPALAAVLVEFARFIASRLPESRPDTVFDALPGQGQIEDSRRLIRGPLALEAIATLGRGDILQLGGRSTAVAADYGDAGGKYTLIVAPYPDSQAAGTAFRNLTDHLDDEIKALAQTETRLVFRDYDGTFGTVSLLADRLELRLRLRQQPPLQ
jgi:hypothetical protein